MRNLVSSKEKSHKIESMLVLLDRLSDSGFVFRGLTHAPSKGPAGESYKYLLSSDKDISVELIFYPEFEGKPDYILVYMTDNKTGKYFSLDSWLQKTISIGQRSPFDLSAYEGSFEQKLREFLIFLNNLFVSPELKAVVDGRVWVDVEFNWGGAK